MFTSISSALSGLNADSTAIDIVGNNLANLSTTGFKQSDVSFQDLVNQSLTGSASAPVGLGTAPPQSITEFTQGAIQTTSNPFDAAIQGSGFFVVNGAGNQTLLTRAGNFQLSSSGELVTATGQQVQGWTAVNGAVNTSGSIGNITVPSGQTLPPQATKNISLTANLNSSATAASGTFSTQIQAVDSLGNAVPLTVTFTPTATAGQWNYQVSVPGSLTSQGGTTPVNLLTTPGTLTFDSSGNLTTPSSANGNIPLTVTGLADGAANMNLNWSLYSNGSPQLTQFSEASSVSANSQDGQPAAQLSGVSLGNDGTIVVNYSNGVQKIAGQVALGSVVNPESLADAGNNNFSLTSQSSALTVGAPDTGGRGQVLSQSLESSTVDIASQFTNLLSFERAYQANSRVVTASDELAQDTMALIK